MNMSGIKVRDIRGMLDGESQETPSQPERKRVRRSSKQASRSVSRASRSVSPPSPTPSLSLENDESFVKYEIDVLESSPRSPAASPGSFQTHAGDIGTSLMQPSQSPSPSHDPLKLRRDIVTLNNYGSEEDSDNSDDEEAPVIPGIPRAYQILLETPLDQDEEEPASVYDPTSTSDPTPTTESTPTSDPTPISDPAHADVPLKATNRPWSLHEFEWKEFSEFQILPEMRREPFSQIDVGPTTPHHDPYDIFIDIWDREIMEHIASETNKYAQQVADAMYHGNCLRPTSRITRWYEITIDELYAFFGIVLAMGLVVKTRMEEYWSSTPDIFITPGFRAHMAFDRFLMINKCLHFNDNHDMSALGLGSSEAELYKIQPIVSHLNNKFQELYTLSQNIALDESILMWKGWLEISQLIPSKASKKSIKSYEICEPQTGYLWRFEIQAHDKTPPQHNEDSLASSIPSIVLRLMNGLEHQGYTLWLDSKYNSPCLARRLKSLGVDCVGTLRTDRKFVPQDLHNLTKQNMSRGQIAGLTSGDVDVMVWRDANRVSMISTYHGIRQHTLKGSTKPTLMFDYNVVMGGLDKKDQLLATYPIERKRTMIWYKKLFKRLLNISVLNSHIIHRHISSVTHRNFRINLIKSLLSKHTAPSGPPIIPPIPIKKQVDITHRLSEYAMRPGSHQRMRRVCRMCKKKIRTFCVGCNETVCMEPCFQNLHA